MRKAARRLYRINRPFHRQQRGGKYVQLFFTVCAALSASVALGQTAVPWTIETVAGAGFSGYGGDGGPAAQARLNRPVGVALDGAGNLYIADGFNHRIRKVDAAGVISTVAGDGTASYGGDGGPAAQALLSRPADVAVDGAGNLYIADTYNHRIRKVDAAGVISTVAGAGREGYGGDGGPAAQAWLNQPSGVAVDGAGNLYIGDQHNHRIRRLRPTPRISAGGIVLATGTPVVSRISPNAIVSVFGQDFAPPGRQESSALDAAGRVADRLAGVCLEIGGRRTLFTYIDGKRAPLFYVSPTQINAQVPHDLTPGRTQAAVIDGCGSDAEYRGPETPVEIGAVSPAFFNFVDNGDGRNPLVAMHGGGPRPGRRAGPAARSGVHARRAGRDRHPVRNRLRSRRAAIGNGSNPGRRGQLGQRGRLYRRRHRGFP